MAEQHEHEHEHHPEHGGHVEVAVVTTSGRYPQTGENRVPEHQQVGRELDRAKQHLKIVNTNGWVARVDGREIEVAKSYAANHLTGKVIIDWGPQHGGGGNA